MGELFDFEYGKSLTKESRVETGKYPVFGSNGIVGYHDKYLVKGPALIVGRKGAAGEVSISNDNFFPIDTTYFVRQSNSLSIRYSYYLLKSLQLSRLEKSTAIPGLNRDDAYRLLIRLCPLQEQRRIVEKVEELFSELDKGVESLKTAHEQLKVYRQAVLKHAFEGKITEKWRQEHASELESAETLLERIKAERDRRYQQQLGEWTKAVKAWESSGGKGKKPTKPSKPKELPSLTRAELAELPELPGGWWWVKLSTISENIQIGPFGSLLHRADYASGGIPLVNPSHIKNHSIEPDWNLTVTEEKSKSLTRYRMKVNDIVMGRRGEMGRCAVVSANEVGWLCGTGSLFIRLAPMANPDFYCNALSSRRTRSFLSGESIGTTMQNLNEDILHGVPVPLCSLNEQNEVLQQVDSRLSFVDQLEGTIDDGLQKAEALRQSILKKAFEGRLVPQDPNDEPASVLLERIRMEKAKQKGKQGKTKK